MSRGTALLLVDVQKDFLARPGLSPDAESLTSAIADLLELARSRGWMVVHTRIEAAPDGSNWMPHWNRTGRPFCLAGSEGCDPPDAVRELEGEPVLTKRFFSAFEDARLQALLEERDIGRLVVAGVHTHACVRASITDAYARGYDVLVAREAVGSCEPEHAALTLDWIEGRAARVLSLDAIRTAHAEAPAVLARARIWTHRNPADWTEVLSEIPFTPLDDVPVLAARLAERQARWGAAPLAQRVDLLRGWLDRLSGERQQWVDLLIQDVGKPRIDAEGEVAYGLALLDHVCATLADREGGTGCEVRYRPIGLAALVTPWNNPFAIPISKIAPALGFGNCALWKPALPAANISERLLASLDEAGLGGMVGLVQGGEGAGAAVVGAPGVGAIAFTGSVAAGRQIAHRCGRLLRPMQGELGGNNAVIVLRDADLGETAAELAKAMFSFAGQRCTAVRRIIVEEGVLESFSDALKAAVEALRVGMPEDAATHVGPVISMPARARLLAAIEDARSGGARLLTGGTAPPGLSADGCWVAPTVLTDLPVHSAAFEEELFGPVVALSAARDLGEAIEQHNRVDHGLLGAIFTADPAAQDRFLGEAEAGMLLINQARPAFSPAGPFAGWKASGYGLAEHGRWNRDFYTRVQAVYGR